VRARRGAPLSDVSVRPRRPRSKKKNEPAVVLDASLSLVNDDDLISAPAAANADRHILILEQIRDKPEGEFTRGAWRYAMLAFWGIGVPTVLMTSVLVVLTILTTIWAHDDREEKHRVSPVTAAAESRIDGLRLCRPMPDSMNVTGTARTPFREIAAQPTPRALPTPPACDD
jgi:hypothetical protein